MPINHKLRQKWCPETVEKIQGNDYSVKKPTIVYLLGKNNKQLFVFGHGARMLFNRKKKTMHFRFMLYTTMKMKLEIDFASRLFM